MGSNSIAVVSEIEADIGELEENVALYEETNFDSRADAIDFIEFHIIARIEGLQQKIGLKEPLDILKYRAGQVKNQLENIDTHLFELLREKIKTGTYTKSSFVEIIRRYIKCDTSQPDSVGYDNLDIFINGLISDYVIPAATTEQEPGMVFYQKTPARVIFELADLAQLWEEDVFFDLGSGLGQVAILINLISGATVKGIEYEPAYCAYASVCAAQLNLSNIEFINADARNGDYSTGTIFFMYTPFEGNMLQNMLEILRKETQKRTIRIFAYGPCSALVAGQNWLSCVNGNGDNPYKLYEFRSLESV